MVKLSQRLLHVYAKWRNSLFSFAGGPLISPGSIVGFAVAILVVVGLVIAGVVGTGFLVRHLMHKQKK